ncbi:MAG: hypothetical protein G01um101491_133 [Parcubacteria group bacterium Gr01-1014_91]|nr:MAG: hypothetical protein G01um101491_133 [Parcubacteria group bacterium Gr01-1014_91]
MGLWYSPFQLETVGVKEPPDAGSIPAPATRKTKTPALRWCFCLCEAGEVVGLYAGTGDAHSFQSFFKCDDHSVRSGEIKSAFV